jgi:hypothetical protein
LNSAAGAAQGYPWSVDVGSDFWLDADDDRVVTVPTFARIAGFTSLSLPYWFLLIAATISAGLTISRFRFSLRTLLIAMTLIAVLLGIVAIST